MNEGYFFMKGMFIYDTHNFIIRLFTDKTTGSCRCIYGSCHRRKIINILAAVTLGPWYSVGIAFCASLLRNLLGLGSMMAFPGSMVGALCCGLVYSICHKLSLTCLAEALGTGILGGLAAYPVAVYIMGITPAGIFVYVVPFLISTIAGSILAFLLITALNKGGLMAMIKTTR